MRGLAMARGDDDILHITGPVFDGIYEYRKRAILLGREPAGPPRVGIRNAANARYVPRAEHRQQLPFTRTSSRRRSPPKPRATGV